MHRILEGDSIEESPRLHTIYLTAVDKNNRSLSNYKIVRSLLGLRGSRIDTPTFACLRCRPTCSSFSRAMSIELLVLRRDRCPTLWSACLGCDWKSQHLGRALVWKVSSEKGLCRLPGRRHQRPNRWKRPARGLIDQRVANRKLAPSPLAISVV